MDSSIIRKSFVCYGRVQGVGFRYKTRYLADRFHLTGWVENNYDGSVSMELQGTQESMDFLFSALDSDRYIRIEDISVHSLSVDCDERSFRVKGY